MAERPEKVHVVMRHRVFFPSTKIPVKVADDREDARAYARRQNVRSRVYCYTVKTCKKL